MEYSNNFFYITEKLKTFLTKKNLPGEKAQYLMAPPRRIEELKQHFNHKEKPRESAVTLVLKENQNKQISIVLIERSSYKGVHSAQIAFPGGQRDPDDINLKETALREAFEEIGIEKKLFHVIGELSPLYVPPSNFMMYPFIAYIKNQEIYHADTREVKQIMDIPLEELFSQQNKKLIEIKTSYGAFKDTPIYSYNNKVIWGATAMILSEFEQIVKTIIKIN
ncbi:MAG: CoA pyrophosphatase [Bacteroidales bacterium]